MNECCHCINFWKCEDSVLAYRKAVVFYPGTSVEALSKRIDYMRETFKDCPRWMEDE